MKSIVIPRIGGDVCQGIARCIAERYPVIELIGQDINPNCGWQAHVNKFIPQGEKLPHNVVHFPYYQSGLNAAICDDKLLFQDLLVMNGIRGPYTSERPFDKCFKKPRWGWGGHGTGEIYQELLVGPEITVPMYVTGLNQVRMIQLERKLVSGTTSWAKVVNHPSVYALCMDVADVLGFKGAYNIQLMLTKKGPMIFEVNPRFSSTVYMRHCLGFEDAVWATEELMGWDIAKYIPPKIGTEVARVHGAAIL